MTITRSRLYALLLIACLAGYIWLYLSITQNGVESRLMEGCLVKHLTHIPCPSCGSTRALISMIQGDFLQALILNPFSYLIAGVLILIPFWIMIDFLRRKNTLFIFYQKAETYLKKPKYAIPLILLVAINWVWNILKGL